MRLLYAEDEKALADAVADILTYHNYTVDTVYDGAEALAYARVEQYDGILLDVMLPKMDGIEVLRTLRAAGCNTPIMLLTAKSEVEDRVAGLDAGADDYLAKPFHMAELLARVRAMLRRREPICGEVLRLGNLSLDLQSYELCCGEVRMVLPKIEYRLMELFLLHRGIFLSTEDLLTKVWGYDTESDIGIVWVYISYLRKRLATLGANVAIVAKRGVGYKLEEIL